MFHPSSVLLWQHHEYKSKFIIFKITLRFEFLDDSGVLGQCKRCTRETKLDNNCKDKVDQGDFYLSDPPYQHTATCPSHEWGVHALDHMLVWAHGWLTCGSDWQECCVCVYICVCVCVISLNIIACCCCCRLPGCNSTAFGPAQPSGSTLTSPCLLITFPWPFLWLRVNDPNTASVSDVHGVLGNMMDVESQLVFVFAHRVNHLTGWTDRKWSLFVEHGIAFCCTLFQNIRFKVPYFSIMVGVPFVDLR